MSVSAKSLGLPPLELECFCKAEGRIKHVTDNEVVVVRSSEGPLGDSIGKVR